MPFQLDVMLLFSGVADAVVYAFAARVVDDFLLFINTTTHPME